MLEHKSMVDMYRTYQNYYYYHQFSNRDLVHPFSYIPWQVKMVPKFFQDNSGLDKENKEVIHYLLKEKKKKSNFILKQKVFVTSF